MAAVLRVLVPILPLLVFRFSTTAEAVPFGPGNVDRPELEKLGTVDVSACETTPLVINGSLWRFESLHSANWGNVDTQIPKRSYFRFVNMGSEQGWVSPPFAWEYELGCAYHEEDSKRVWAFGTFKGHSTNEPGIISAFWSDDGMQTWESKVVLNSTAAVPGNGSSLKTVWNTYLVRNFHRAELQSII